VVLTLSAHYPDALKARRKTRDDAHAQPPCPSYRPAPLPPASWIFFSNLPIVKLPEAELPIGACRDWDFRSGLAEWGRADRDLPILKPLRGLLPRSNPP